MSGDGQLSDVHHFIEEYNLTMEQLQLLAREEYQISMADELGDALAPAIFALANYPLRAADNDLSTTPERLARQQIQAGMLMDRLKNTNTLLRIHHPPDWFLRPADVNDDVLHIESLQFTATHNVTLVQYALINEPRHRGWCLYTWLIRPAGDPRTRLLTVSLDCALGTAAGEGMTALSAILDVSEDTIGERPVDIAERQKRLRNAEQNDESLYKLYALLIAPAVREGFLPTDESGAVVFVPHGSLLHVPWLALKSRADERYLIDRFHISVAPSIRMLFELHRRFATAPPLAPASAFLCGNPTYPRFHANRNPNKQLPVAQAEVEEIGKLFGVQQEQILVRDAATRSAVLAGLQAKPSIIHLSTHGSESGHANGGKWQRGHLCLAAPLVAPATAAAASASLPAVYPVEADCSLYAGDVADLQLTSCRLAVLSACQTALGRTSSDGTVGLSRAFLVAGCHAVIASLWNSTDHSSKTLMLEFYRRWIVVGESQLVAFRAAVLHLKRNIPGLPVLSPDKWAPYILTTGDLAR